MKYVINAVIDAESTISLDRVVIPSKSFNYLQDLGEIISRFNITYKLNKNCGYLGIFGKRNIKKIFSYFDITQDKSVKIIRNLNSGKIEQSPKGLSKSLYLKSLLELGTATSKEIRDNAGRRGNSFRQYIKQLEDLGYIELLNNKNPKKYRITVYGTKYLNSNIIYWI